MVSRRLEPLVRVLGLGLGRVLGLGLARGPGFGRVLGLGRALGLGRVVGLGLALGLGLGLGLGACEPPPGAPSDEPDATDTPGWQTLFHDLAPALLSVWGSATDDVFVVGSDPGDGRGPWLLHWNGTAWERLPTGESGTLWSVAGTDRAGPVYAVGADGLALRFDRATGSLTRLTGVDAGVTLRAVFVLGASVWAVGGRDAIGQGVAYTLVGDGFVALSDVPAQVGDGGAFEAVWGRSATDLWIVGDGDQLLHKDASGWHAFTSPEGRRLRGVHGNGAIAVAVGGLLSGIVAELSESGVTNATPPEMPPMNGVWARPDGMILAVGAQGSVWERTGNHWRASVGLPSSVLEYRGVYVDPAGDTWVVGGALTEPQRQGVLLHDGAVLGAGATTLPE